MKKKLLILSTQQFGYLTDTFKYCQYAGEEFEITYICWDYQKPKINLPGINVKYVSRKGSLIARNFRILKVFNQEIKNNYDAVFANYARGISFVKLLNPNKKIIFDIRTLSANPSATKRWIYNFFLKLESLFFNKVTIISDGVAKRIGIKNYSLLPLGADPVEIPVGKSSSKTDCLHLLYVGTLDNRDIIKCVRGFHLYCRKNKDKEAKFTIIGDSRQNELEIIKKYVYEHGLENQIFLTGRIPHDQLGTYFQEATVGVSFIPMTKYYDFQPPTKTFEYLLSGIPVIATKTHENKEILKNSSHSVLINDNENEFANAITLFKNNSVNMNSAQIAANVQLFTWKLIIKDRFMPLLKEINYN